MKQLDMNVLKEIAGGNSVTCSRSENYFGANNEFLFSVKMNVQGSDCASIFSEYVRMEDPILALDFMNKLKGAVNANRGGNVYIEGASTFNSRPLEIYVGGSADAIAKTLPSI